MDPLRPDLRREASREARSHAKRGNDEELSTTFTERDSSFILHPSSFLIRMILIQEALNPLFQDSR
jgi:hypothetical protein